MALSADFNFRPIDEERSNLSELRHLFAAGLLHQRMAVDTGKAARSVSARLPIALDPPFMAAEAGLVLYFGGFAGIFPERNHTADAFAAAGRDMLASRAMAILARPTFRFVTRVVQKYLAHQSCREFFELGRMASLTNFIADISGRGGLGRIGRRGPNP
jgi:hypothetical protein